MIHFSPISSEPDYVQYCTSINKKQSISLFRKKKIVPKKNYPNKNKTNNKRNERQTTQIRNMPLTTAERNKKRRDKKKQERLLQKKLSDEDKNNFDNTNKGDVNNEGEGDDIEYEYVVEPIVIPSSFLSTTGNTIDGNKVDANGNSAMTMATTTAMTVNDSMENAADATSSSAPPQDGGLADVLRRFQDRAGVLVSDDENGSGDDAAAISKKNANGDNNDNNNNSDDNEVSWSDIDDDGDNSEYGSGDEDGNDGAISKRRMREINRPTVAELKKRVERADLVEAHDVTAPDPDFLLYLKSIAGSVPVPRHWGRKRKYLQGKVRDLMSCSVICMVNLCEYCCRCRWFNGDGGFDFDFLGKGNDVVIQSLFFVPYVFSNLSILNIHKRKGGSEN